MGESESYYACLIHNYNFAHIYLSFYTQELNVSVDQVRSSVFNPGWLWCDKLAQVYKAGKLFAAYSHSQIMISKLKKKKIVQIIGNAFQREFT